MDKNELIEKIDFNNVMEETKNISGIDFKEDFIVDSEGNKILRLQPLEVKLIEWIKTLEAKNIELEERIDSLKM